MATTSKVGGTSPSPASESLGGNQPLQQRPESKDTSENSVAEKRADRVRRKLARLLLDMGLVVPSQLEPNAHYTAADEMLVEFAQMGMWPHPSSDVEEIKKLLNDTRTSLMLERNVLKMKARQMDYLSNFMAAEFAREGRSHRGESAGDAACRLLDTIKPLRHQMNEARAEVSRQALLIEKLEGEILSLRQEVEDERRGTRLAGSASLVDQQIPAPGEEGS